MDVELTIKNLQKYITFASKSKNFSCDKDFEIHKYLAHEVQTLLIAYEELDRKNKSLGKKLNYYKLINERDCDEEFEI